MNDFYEIDFLAVGDTKSGDAIAMRYRMANDPNRPIIHITDGGYEKTGADLISHIKKYYDNPSYIDHVVLTHPDGDHAAGLKILLESNDFKIGTLWMFRPWDYSKDFIKAESFKRWKNHENLSDRLKKNFKVLKELEEIAVRKGIQIKEPFQGEKIGRFTVTSPDPETFFDLLIKSNKTPDPHQDFSLLAAFESFSHKIQDSVKKTVNLIRAIWGEEYFPEKGSSAENERSVIQFARLCNHNILLTGDAGREGLKKSWDYIQYNYLNRWENIHKFQVPHHGGRHNVDTDSLNYLFGDPIPTEGNWRRRFTAIISAAKNDEHHPRKAVVRALIHRGGEVLTTEGTSIRTSYNAPNRPGWEPVTPKNYPTQMEN